MEQETAASLLRDLADSPAPPSTVDVRRAAATGRRRLRVRRMVASGSAVVGVAAVAVGLTQVLGTAPAAGPSPQLPGAVAEPSALPDVAPEAFDPLVQYAEFGWVPDGSTGGGINTGRDWLLVSADYPGLATSGNDEPAPAGVYLMLVTAGHGIDVMRFTDFAVDPAQAAPGVATDPVNGRPAEWVDVAGPAEVLRWEYAPGAWAAVRVDRNLPGVDAREVARQVAESVRYGVDRPVKLPFATTGVPAQLPAAELRLSRHTDGWSAQVLYGEQRTSYGDWPLSILAVANDRETGDQAVLGDPNTTVDGHPARTSDLQDGGSGLQVFNVDGVYVEILTHSAEATTLLPDGLVGLFRATTFFPDPADWR
jgi:hypothetical protein